ncbi:MAG: hypothetical protein GYA02_00225, partial [Clostridiaceae bacterium]|nr:hypothetical protein [Clostridiaceae bacterium]
MRSEFDDITVNIHDGTGSSGKISPEIDDKIKKAYKVMGVREGASREEIERRYYILTKKHLILQRENVKSEVVGLNMEKINEAYYLLIDLEKQDSYIGVSNQSDGNVQKLI